jgi:hypothetical protein
MKFALLGAFLITLPAIAALVYGLFIQPNSYIVMAASASVFLNSLPFVAAGWMLRGTDSSDLGH